MSSQPPMGGHLTIPQNNILHTNEPPMSFLIAPRVAVHSWFYCDNETRNCNISNSSRASNEWKSWLTNRTRVPVYIKPLQYWNYMSVFSSPLEKNDTQVFVPNPCAAELFACIFPSFEAGIANAISSFEWRKKFIFMKKRHLQYWSIGSTKHLLKIIFSNLVIFLCLKQYIYGHSRRRVEF